MKIYVVSVTCVWKEKIEGEYLIGICSSEEKANAFIEEYKNTRYYDHDDKFFDDLKFNIEECEIDEPLFLKD